MIHVLITKVRDDVRHLIHVYRKITKIGQQRTLQLSSSKEKSSSKWTEEKKGAVSGKEKEVKEAITEPGIARTQACSVSLFLIILN